MKNCCILIVTLLLVGCAGEDKQSDFMCDDPIAVQGYDQRDLAYGYIVSVIDSVDVSVKSVELIELYDDLEVYAVYSSSNGFHGNSGDQTLSSLRCDTEIDHIQYDLPVGLAN
jgi:hypothetical protein